MCFGAAGGMRSFAWMGPDSDPGSRRAPATDDSGRARADAGCWLSDPSTSGSTSMAIGRLAVT